MVRDLWIVKEILKEEVPSDNFSWIQLFRICKKSNLRNYYIGDKHKNYHITKTSEPLENNFNAKYKKTLFRHDEKDHYYYDILDHDTKYQLLTEQERIVHNVCDNISSLEQKVKKIRWKETI